MRARRLAAALAAVLLALLTPAGVSAQARVLTLTADSAGPLTLALSGDVYRLRLDLTQLGADSATVECRVLLRRSPPFSDLLGFGCTFRSRSMASAEAGRVLGGT
jgi:hypothetical protein